VAKTIKQSDLPAIASDVELDDDAGWAPETYNPADKFSTLVRQQIEHEDYFDDIEEERRQYVGKLAKRRLVQTEATFHILDVQLDEGFQYGWRWECRTDLPAYYGHINDENKPVWLTMSCNVVRDLNMEKMAGYLASGRFPLGIAVRLVEGNSASGYTFFDFGRPTQSEQGNLAI